MLKTMRVLAVLALFAVCAAQAGATVIDFEAVALRPADDGSGYGTIVEYADETGVSVNITAGGQKVYYGTDYFNGLSVGSIEYIEFTFKNGSTKSPYTNLVITDGTNFGVISTHARDILSSVIETDSLGNIVSVTQRMRFYYAQERVAGTPNGITFYEPSDENATWPHGTSSIDWSDIETWTLLGVGQERYPLSDGEMTYAAQPGVPRGPVEDGVAIFWGDSATNYLGHREIYDVVVKSAGVEYTAGVVPEPASFAIWGLLACCGIVSLRRR